MNSSSPQPSENQPAEVLQTKPGQLFTVRSARGREASFDAAKWGRLQNEVFYPLSMRERVEDMKRTLMLPDAIVSLGYGKQLYVKKFPNLPEEENELTVKTEDAVDKQGNPIEKVILPLPQQFLGRRAP